MKTRKLTTSVRSVKETRVYSVLEALVRHYIETGKPVGSHSLKETGFPHLSSATLRNYFAQLEQEGFLHQLHASGGRIPTDRAYRYYAQELLAANQLPKVESVKLSTPEHNQTREIARFLQEAAEILSHSTQTAVVLAAPRFDHDYIIDIKVVTLDSHRCLCILITDFGVIQTAVLHSLEKLSSFAAKRLESYFMWRLTGRDKPTNLEKNEERLAQEFYNEMMVRYIVRYSNFTDEDIYRTGFSMLLNYPEFIDAEALASSLAFFENIAALRLLLRDCASHGQLKYWLGEDLQPFAGHAVDAAVLAIPYCIHQSVAGALALVGPTRLPYDKLFATLKHFSEKISETLTQSVYKFKISVRQPAAQMVPLPDADRLLLEQSTKILLEDKRHDS